MVLRQARHRQPAQNPNATPAISHGVNCESSILQPIEHQRPPYDVIPGRLVRLGGSSQFHSPNHFIAPSNSPANFPLRPPTRSRTRLQFQTRAQRYILPNTPSLSLAYGINRFTGNRYSFVPRLCCSHRPIHSVRVVRSYTMVRL